MTSQHAFKMSVISEFFVSMHKTLQDNFDARRYNVDVRDHSREFALSEHSFFLDWFFTHQADLFEAQQLLSDETSRQMFRALVLYRLGGHLHVRLPSAVARNTERRRRFDEVTVATPSDIQLPGRFGRLAHYDFQWDSRRYVIDCIQGGLVGALVYGQYQYDRDGVRVMPEPGDHVIDGGACLGDTAMLFSHLVGAEGRVYAFDPVEEHLLVCMENTRTMPHANVSVLPVGLSNENVDARPIRVGGYAPGFKARQPSGCQGPVPVRALDFMVESGEVKRIDFLKLDVEGAELDALRGGLNSILRFRPKMAISLYHKPNDLFEIIRFVSRAFPFYELYLDHYTIHREETVLYCRLRT
jgi:FkbM family methyltransferase